MQTTEIAMRHLVAADHGNVYPIVAVDRDARIYRLPWIGADVAKDTVVARLAEDAAALGRICLNRPAAAVFEFRVEDEPFAVAKREDDGTYTVILL